MALGTCVYYTCQNLTPSCLALLEENFHVISLPNPLHDSSLERANLGAVTAIFGPIGYRFGRTEIQRYPNLKAVISNTTSVYHFDTGACSDAGIVVCSLVDEQEFLSTITPTAEHTLGLIHALHRRIPSACAIPSRYNKWDRYHHPAPERMLSQMTLGIIGMGRIGSMVARRSVDLFKKLLWTDIAKPVHELDWILAESDVLTLHIDGRPENRNFVDEDFLSKMRPGSLLINTGRGEHIDTGALLRALNEGHLGGAALDVLPGEHRPMFLDDNRAIFDYARGNDNLILTPHIAGSTQDAWEATQRRVIEKAIEVCT